MSGPQRVLVYGVTGSGKTTLAAKIAAVQGLPWWSVDDLTWSRPWVMMPPEEQRALFGRVCQGERWVLDTAYGSWVDLAYERAELIVGLDYPRWRSFARLLRRTVLHIALHRPTCNGNYETVRNALARDSILRWHISSYARKRARMRGWAADLQGRTVVLLRSPRQAERWLRGLGYHDSLPLMPFEARPPS